MINIKILEKRKVMVNHAVQIYEDYDNCGIYVYWLNNKPCYIGKANSQTIARRIAEQLSYNEMFGKLLKKIAIHIGCNPFRDRMKIKDWIEENLLVSVVPIQVYTENGMDDNARKDIDNMELQLLSTYPCIFNWNKNLQAKMNAGLIPTRKIYNNKSNDYKKKKLKVSKYQRNYYKKNKSRILKQRELRKLETV